MAEILDPGEANPGAPAMMGFEHQEGMKESETALHDSSVVIDIERLSLLMVANNKDSTPSPRVSRKLSSKGSRRGGVGVGEIKAAAGDTTPATPTNFPTTGGVGTCEKSSLLVQVERQPDPSSLPFVATPTAAGGSGSRGRRLGKRSSRWIDPRRVLLFFATLSSMGTLILLYFTLCTGKIDGDDGH